MKRERRPCVYILTNKRNAVLYTGVTSNLLKRIAEHKSMLVPSFTSRYKVTKLVYYEEHTSMIGAIARENKSRVALGRRRSI